MNLYDKDAKKKLPGYDDFALTYCAAMDNGRIPAKPGFPESLSKEQKRP